MASNTPFRLYKTNTHQGGQQVPHGSLGRGLPSDKELRHQYQHVTDILPTICELVVDIRIKGGEQLPPAAGNSFAGSLQTLRRIYPSGTILRNDSIEESIKMDGHLNDTTTRNRLFETLGIAWFTQ